MKNEIVDFLARLGTPIPDAPRPCGFPSWTYGGGEDESCAGPAHMSGRTYLRECPSVVADRSRDLAASERARLAGLLLRLGGVPTFAGHDVSQGRGSARALEAMRAFAGAASPARGVLLSGQVGRGKTRLLVASHFARLSAGMPSEYVTALELRPVFRAVNSFDAEAQREARGIVRRLALALAVHIDDLGDVTGSAAFHADFAAGFKGLLDGAKGAIAVALNLTRADAAKHPDIGERVLSRLCGGVVVRMEGEDQRLRVAP